MSGVKLCKDCKYYRTRGLFWVEQKCTRYSQQLSLIDGSPSTREEDCFDERVQRSIFRRCGPEGKYFEPKEV